MCFAGSERRRVKLAGGRQRVNRGRTKPDSLNLDTYVSTRVFKTALRNDV